jgi:thioredoxin 1
VKLPVKMRMVATLLILASPVAFAGDVAPATNSPATTNAMVKARLPRLVDLGADKCIPCKKMAPILSELKTNYVGQLEVEFIDVWKEPDAAKAYKIRLIPTQIFYDANGKEAFRHEGFYGKEDILAKCKELGVNLKSPK